MTRAHEPASFAAPSCLDMRAELVMILYVLASWRPGGNLAFLFTGDGKIGSPSSWALIGQEARSTAWCPVTEAAADSSAAEHASIADAVAGGRR